MSASVEVSDYHHDVTTGGGLFLSAIVDGAKGETRATWMGLTASALTETHTDSYKLCVNKHKTFLSPMILHFLELFLMIFNAGEHLSG